MDKNEGRYAELGLFLMLIGMVPYMAGLTMTLFVHNYQMLLSAICTIVETVPGLTGAIMILVGILISVGGFAGLNFKVWTR